MSCHGSPSPDKVIKDGDNVNIDVTVIKDGWHGDTSRMYYVGKPDVLEQRLPAQRAVLPGAGHSVQRLGAPFNDVLHAFVARAEAS